MDALWFTLGGLERDAFGMGGVVPSYPIPLQIVIRRFVLLYELSCEVGQSVLNLHEELVYNTATSPYSEVYLALWELISMAEDLGVSLDGVSPPAREIMGNSSGALDLSTL